MEAISDDPPWRVQRPILRQAWWTLTFLHWKFSPQEVRPLIPPELELDLFDGYAWVGLVPFYLTNLTHVNAPAVPWISHFLETNVRTYVYDREGKRGVWFFSLDAARLTAVVGARAAYALPYYWAKMSLKQEGNNVRYSSRRRHGPPAATDIEIEFGERIDTPSALESFLSARWRLFAHRGGQLLRADVEHPRWPLHRAQLIRVSDTLLRAAGVEGRGEPDSVIYSPGVSVLTGWPGAVGR